MEAKKEKKTKKRPVEVVESVTEPKSKSKKIKKNTEAQQDTPKKTKKISTKAILAANKVLLYRLPESVIKPSDTKLLEQDIQEYIDKTWTPNYWKNSKVYELRQNCKNLLNEGLIDALTLYKENPNAKSEITQNTDIQEQLLIVSTIIEQAMYDKHSLCLNPDKYCQAIRLFYLNTTPETIERIVCDEIDPVYYATMDANELANRDAIPNVPLIKQTTQQRDIYGSKSESRCKKCGGADVQYFSLQLRRADENQTIFFTCNNTKCGHRWVG